MFSSSGINNWLTYNNGTSGINHSVISYSTISISLFFSVETEYLFIFYIFNSWSLSACKLSWAKANTHIHLEYFSAINKESLNSESSHTSW